MEDWMEVIMIHSTPRYHSPATKKMAGKFAICTSFSGAVVLSDSHRAVIDVHSSQVWPLSVQRQTNTFQAAEKTVGIWNKTKTIMH
jgi:hypothetical protein